MHGISCIHCFSDDVEFKADILVGCCQHKSGEIWLCNDCGKEMVIETVYTDEEQPLNCPHQAENGSGGVHPEAGCGREGCAGCANGIKKIK